MQALECMIDRIPKAVVRANHADRNIPVEVFFGFVGIEDADRLVRMRLIEKGRNRRRDRGGSDGAPSTLRRPSQPPVREDDDMLRLRLDVDSRPMLDPRAELLHFAGGDLVEIDPDLHQRHGKQPRCEVQAQFFRLLDLVLHSPRKLGGVQIVSLDHRRVARPEIDCEGLLGADRDRMSTILKF